MIGSARRAQWYNSDTDILTVTNNCLIRFKAYLLRKKPMPDALN